jgi:biofilm PGA synthesis N-glycosyltransferase PgaC
MDERIRPPYPGFDRGVITTTPIVLIEIIFWLAAAVVLYTYVGYPVLVGLWGTLFPYPVQAAPITPPITILIAAHNEERHIGEKIENCLGLAYPPHRLELVVVSDGSTDRTVEIVQAYAARYPDRVKLITLANRSGKAHALNVGVAAASGEILLLADVRQRFDPQVAAALARNFADANVGAASGELLIVEEHVWRQRTSPTAQRKY